MSSKPALGSPIHQRGNAAATSEYEAFFNDLDGYTGDAVGLPSYTVAGVPSAADNTAGLIYVSNETGGAVPAFSDGTNWRRVTDRTVIAA